MKLLSFFNQIRSLTSLLRLWRSSLMLACPVVDASSCTNGLSTFAMSFSTFEASWRQFMQLIERDTCKSLDVHVVGLGELLHQHWVFYVLLRSTSSKSVAYSNQLVLVFVHKIFPCVKQILDGGRCTDNWTGAVCEWCYQLLDARFRFGLASICHRSSCLPYLDERCIILIPFAFSIIMQQEAYVSL